MFAQIFVCMDFWPIFNIHPSKKDKNYKTLKMMEPNTLSRYKMTR